jgi:hypothetical protein
MFQYVAFKLSLLTRTILTSIQYLKNKIYTKKQNILLLKRHKLHNKKIASKFEMILNKSSLVTKGTLKI